MFPCIISNQWKRNLVNPGMHSHLCFAYHWWYHCFITWGVIESLKGKLIRHLKNIDWLLFSIESYGFRIELLEPNLARHFFFVINNFLFFFSHTTQHNIQIKQKKKKTADTYSTSQGSIKREGEREGQQEHKSYSKSYSLNIITYIQQKTLPSLNGWRPGP